jgi:starch-binding outer membrane protein, SusD/RagB family
MEKIKKYTIALSFFSILLFISCEDQLNEAPISQVTDNQFWKSNSDAVLGVAAIYDAMQNHYSSRHFLWGEFRADNYIASSSTQGTNLTLLTNNISVSDATTLRWDDMYRMIGRANLAIVKIPTIPGYSPALLGEAYALRAYAYFDAVRVWGSVPLITEPVTDSEQDLRKPKTDGNIILETVVADMLEAERLITANTSLFRFSKSSVWAFQANVYMWLKQYDKAKIVLDKIVALNTFKLAATRQEWSRLFLNDPAPTAGQFQVGPELIFSIKYDLAAGDRSGVYGLFFAGIPSFYIAPTLENKWIQKFPIDKVNWDIKYPTTPPVLKNPNGTFIYGDWRYFESREAKPIGTARVAKWNKTNYNPSLDDTDIVIFRYAGILLMLAEAENQIGQPTNITRAIDLVNQIRVARQLPTVKSTDFLTKQDRENLILDERQMELLGEGQRWWDLRRTGKAVEIMGPINKQTEAKLIFPILQEHLNENPALEQDPAYR